MPYNFVSHTRIGLDALALPFLASRPIRWGILGVLLEGFGFLNLFGNFIPTVLVFARQLPILGPVLSHPYVAPVLNKLSGAVGSKKASRSNV